MSASPKGEIWREWQGELDPDGTGGMARHLATRSSKRTPRSILTGDIANLTPRALWASEVDACPVGVHIHDGSGSGAGRHVGAFDHKPGSQYQRGKERN